MLKNSSCCHTREGGYPENPMKTWIPAFARMTNPGNLRLFQRRINQKSFVLTFALRIFQRSNIFNAMKASSSGEMRAAHAEVSAQSVAPPGSTGMRYAARSKPPGHCVAVSLILNPISPPQFRLFLHHHRNLQSSKDCARIEQQHPASKVQRFSKQD